MWNAILGIISKITKPLTNLIDDLHTSKEEKLLIRNELERIQNDLAKELVDYASQEMNAQKEIIIAEIKEGWLSRNWRPCLMMIIVGIIANNFVLFPYLSLFTDKVVILDLPKELYDLMQIGVGGYIIGRSGEKIIDKWKKPTK